MGGNLQNDGQLLEVLLISSIWHELECHAQCRRSRCHPLGFWPQPGPAARTMSCSAVLGAAPPTAQLAGGLEQYAVQALLHACCQHQQP
jgi:hypothetical protein